MTDNPPGQTRPFATVLNDLRAGEVLDEAATLLQQLTAAVRDRGKKGKLTLEIVIEPMKNGGAALNVSAALKSTLPPPEPVVAVFFADRENNLVRDDPRQQEIPNLREVPRATPNPANVKEIAK